MGTHTAKSAAQLFGNMKRGDRRYVTGVSPDHPCARLSVKVAVMVRTAHRDLRLFPSDLTSDKRARALCGVPQAPYVLKGTIGSTYNERQRVKRNVMSHL